ncbi:MAG: LytTR family DNA-binding domain-containing protein [Bacteroidetes bacterium]|nr:LytTR family DNA-binding domain-containing protein [Bacteroidota bacterium]
MIRTLVVDDEARARETIIDMLNLFCNGIEVIGEASSVKTAYEMIDHHQPDLVLLDIKMPDGTGFDLLKKFEKIGFYVIFITAFEEFAIKAFKFSALDYLLKPVDPDELSSAVEKLRTAMEKDSIELRIKAMFQNLNQNYVKNKKLVLKTTTNVHVVELDNVIRCQSDKNYTHFFTIDNEQITVSKTLKEFDELLSDMNFFRAHQSHLINLDYVKRFEKADGGYLVMKDNSTVPVSFRKKEELMRIFKTL